MTQSMVLLFPLHRKSLADPFGYVPKSEVLETPMFSIYTTNLFFVPYTPLTLAKLFVIKCSYGTLVAEAGFEPACRTL